MKKLILSVLISILLWGCYTQIGTLKEDEGYSESKPKKEYRYYSENYDYNYDTWVYHRFVYRYYLPYPRYYLFFRYYTPGFAVGWGEWWYYDPYWFDYYWWDWDWYWWNRYYWYSYYWYSPMWYYYPWWYRNPIIVIINNPYYSPGDGKNIVYRPRNFGSTRGGIRESGSSVNETPNIAQPPSRTAPKGTSSDGTSQSSIGSLRKPAGSGRESTSIERGKDAERPRDTGSTRTPSAPRIVPRSGDGNSNPPRENSTPPQRTSPPRRTGTHRNSIEIYRDYETGRSTLIEIPKHNFPRPSVINHSPQIQINSSNNSSQPEEYRRQIGNRRK